MTTMEHRVCRRVLRGYPAVRSTLSFRYRAHRCDLDHRLVFWTADRSEFGKPQESGDQCLQWGTICQCSMKSSSALEDLEKFGYKSWLLNWLLQRWLACTDKPSKKPSKKSAKDPSKKLRSKRTVNKVCKFNFWIIVKLCSKEYNWSSAGFLPFVCRSFGLPDFLISFGCSSAKQTEHNPSGENPSEVCSRIGSWIRSPFYHRTWSKFFTILSTRSVFYNF